MKQNKILGLAAGLVMSLAAFAPAHAFSLAGGYAGPVKFVVSNLDMGTTYRRPVGPFGNVCNSAASCDAAIASAAPGHIGSEDSWGIFQITAIQSDDSSNTNLWIAGQGGEYLTGMFYGLVDTNVDFFGANMAAVSTGGHTQVYLDTQIADYNAGAALGAAGRTGLNQFTGATNGTLFLDMMFSGTADAFYPGNSYQSTFGGSTLVGSGSGYMDFVGGAYQNSFLSGSEMDALGNPHDAQLVTSFRPDSNVHQWTVTSTGAVYTNKIPEPASLALLGLGLIGLSSLRRKKN